MVLCQWHELIDSPEKFALVDPGGIAPKGPTPFILDSVIRRMVPLQQPAEVGVVHKFLAVCDFIEGLVKGAVVLVQCESPRTTATLTVGQVAEVVPVGTSFVLP